MATTTTIKTEQTVLPAAPPTHKEPLKLSGALDKEKFFDSTPVIGREVCFFVLKSTAFHSSPTDCVLQFPEASLKEWLEAPDSDDLLRDLAITSRTNHLSFDLATPVLIPHRSLPPRRRLLPQTRRTRQRPHESPRSSTGSTSR